MTKYELVSEMAENLEISKKKCTEAFNVMIEEIVSTLEEGGRFTQNGFGTFKVQETNERVGFNPQTGQKLIYPKKMRVRFKLSPKLKDEINE